MTVLAEALQRAMQQAKKNLASHGEVSPEVDMLETQNIAVKGAKINASKLPLFTAPTSPKRKRAENWLATQVARSQREGPFTITIDLTPEIAELLLSRNPSNRHFLAASAVYQGLLRDIRAGAWQHNGETIKIADTGELNDGQHRCHAVVETGIGIVTEATFGLDRDSRLTVDAGIKRTVGGQLQILGKADGNIRAHAASLILIFKKANRFSKLTATKRPTTSEIVAFCDEHELSPNISWGRQLNSKFGISPGLATSIHFLFAEISSQATEDFFGMVKAGSDTRGPAYKLRELLIGNMRRPKERKISDPDIAECFINAWNAWRNRRNPRSLLPDEKNHAFPMPE